MSEGPKMSSLAVGGEDGFKQSEERQSKPKVKYKDKRKSVKISPRAYELLSYYSDVTGVPITKVIDDCVNDWYETVGIGRIEKLTGRANH